MIVTKDALERYRTRKVRILNGAHTSMVPFALLSGFDTVKSCMDDKDMSAFVRACLFEEVIPTLNLSKEELEEYAENVLVRFSNPYIKHFLSSIALNSVSKFRVRVLPSILEFKKRYGSYPKNLVFGFTKLIEFYKVGTPNDSPEAVSALRDRDLAAILADATLWGEDLSDMYEVMKNANPSL